MIDKVPVEALPYYTMNAYLGFRVLNNVYSNYLIAEGVNRQLDDQALYARVKENTKTAREQYNWDLEKEALLNVYTNVVDRKLPIMKDGAPKPVQQ